jgi:hypothetical protein
MEAKIFEAPSAVVSVPPDWSDHSQYILLGPPAAFRQSVVIAFSPATDPTPDAFADKQLPDMRKLPDFVLNGRTRVRLPRVAEPAVRLDFAWKQPTTPRLRQLQFFVLHAGTMYTVTATATEAAFPAAQPELERVVASFGPKLWGGA